MLVEEFVYVFASSKKTYPYANYPRQAELAWFEFPVGNISRAFGPVIVRFWNVSWQKGREIQMTRFYFIVKFEWGDSRTAVKNFSTLQGLVVCLRLVINCTWIFFLSPREPGILQPEFWRMAQSYIRTARFISCFPKHKQIFTIPCCKALIGTPNILSNQSVLRVAGIWKLVYTWSPHKFSYPRIMDLKKGQNQFNTLIYSHYYHWPY